MKDSVRIYDTTLRDGTQGEGLSLSVDDKIKIARRLDEMGFHYIEGGWPGSNPKDAEFFSRLRDDPLKQARLTAFGRTRRPCTAVSEDGNLQAILDSGVHTAAIFGKSWELHVTQALGTTLEENLAMIGETIAYLKGKGLEVVYDAEHFYDGFKHNPAYALKTLERAAEAGADPKSNEQTRNILAEIKRLENQGYQFEGAEASFELLMRKAFNAYKPPFTLETLRVIMEMKEDGKVHSEAVIKIRVEGGVIHTAAEGNGPVNALDNALRKALEDFYPEIPSMTLSDYRVRVLNGDQGTEALVRVLIETSDRHDTWGTVGVSTNIIEASWRSLVDSIAYGLLKRKRGLTQEPGRA